MNRGIGIILLFLLPLVMVAQQEEGMSKKIYHINEAQVYADRPMKEIGVQKTSLVTDILIPARILCFAHPQFCHTELRVTAV